MNEIPAVPGCHEFSLPSQYVDVSYIEGSMHPDSVYFEYCSDIIFSNQGQEISYTATKGWLTLELREKPTEDFQHTYTISIAAEELSFDLPNGVITFPQLQWESVLVGWLPG